MDVGGGGVGVDLSGCEWMCVWGWGGGECEWVWVGVLVCILGCFSHTSGVYVCTLYEQFPCTYVCYFMSLYVYALWIYDGAC